MCGIFALINWDRKTISNDLLIQAAASMRHRGPDEQGVEILSDEAACVGLAHSRLSVIDLETGSQPMCNEDGSIWIVYNGEIYNHEELRTALGSSHQFKTRSDTEVILHAYEEYGTDCVIRLNGMFSFAIWDSNRKRLFTARDRLGQKPLYICQTGGSVVAASSIEAALMTPGISRELDWEALSYYFTYQYVPAPLTAFKKISALPPAHYAVFERNTMTRTRYWTPNYAKKTRMSFVESSEELRRLMDDAVRLRLLSDVPLGAFLSGGIDSSIAVALMSKHAAEPVQTFAIGFPHEMYDERPYARKAAETFATRHTEFGVGPECLEALPDLLAKCGQPFADSSALPTYYLSKHTREHVTVALCGDGGDEIFAGYDRYRAMRMAARADLLPASFRAAAASALKPLFPSGTDPRSFAARARRFLEAAGLDGIERYISIIRHLSDEDRRCLVPGLPDQLPDSATPLSIDFQVSSASNMTERVMETDLLNYLPDDLLVKTDIASMCHSLELRSPFLDHRVVEFAASLPLEFKLKGTSFEGSKHILRHAFADILPEDILRRKKMGFGIPLASWLRKEWSDPSRDLLLDKTTRERGLFDIASIEILLDDHLKARSDNSYRIWNLLCFEQWMRTSKAG